MSTRSGDGHSFGVAVRPAEGGCVWVVTRARAVAMTGLAPSDHSARLCGVLAVSLLQTLERVGRRRF